MRWWKPWPFSQLDRIEQTAARTERRLRTMGTDIHALDEALGTLATDVANLHTAVEALIAAIPPGDFTAEIAAVKAAFEGVEQTTRDAQAATPPPSGEPSGEPVSDTG